MTRVLILDGSIHTDIYTPTADWRRLLGEVPSVSVHLPSGEAVPGLGSFSHVIVTGSEASIVRPEPWFEVEAAAVREAVTRGLCVLGSCFGHQMLAWALADGRHVARSPTPEVGWIEVERTADDPLLSGLESRFHVFACHFDEVRDPPPPWRSLARSSGCAVQILRYGDRPVWGLQAHPETGPAAARTLMEGILTRYPARAGIVRPALEMPPHDDRVAGAIVDRFLEAG